MKLINKIKNWIKESEESCRINYEIENSVDCPYCLRHYFVEEIEKLEKDTDIKNIAVIMTVWENLIACLGDESDNETQSLIEWNIVNFFKSKYFHNS